MNLHAVIKKPRKVKTMNYIDRFIVKSSSFEDFRKRLRGAALSTTEKGDILERLTQVYLQTTPEYRTALDKVWLLDDAPASVFEATGIPRGKDKGIDLIAQHRDGTYWVIQAKYRADEDQALGWKKDLSTFHGLASAPRRNISLTVIVHTTARPISNLDLMDPDKVVEIGLDRWKEADWSLIRRTIEENAPARPTAFAPRPKWKQDEVIDAAVKHFNEHSRGRLLMPCGTGKSLLAFWITEALKAKSIIVAVPSLNLIKQSVAVWMRELVAKKQTPAWLCVASDDSVGGLDNDEFVEERYHSGLPTTTDAEKIAKWLRSKSDDQKIIFTTYHSSKQVAEAAKLAKFAFDLVVFDEAHRTVGARDRDFATLLHDHAIKARRRLFMTATELKIDGDVALFSMDDNEKDYGQRFFTMTFKEAISLGIITDYKIVTYAVTESKVNRLVKKNTLLNLGRENLEKPAAQDFAAAIIVKKAMTQYGVKHALVFNRSIRAAKDFREVQDVLNYVGEGPYAANFHVSSEMSAGRRKQLLDEFKETTSTPAVMTNARCLTEGVDVPGIDCVMFADPKQSVIDIVQAAGRAMRKADGKKYGYIIIPIIVPDNMPFDEFAETTAFRRIVSVISALSTQDTTIVEELQAIFGGPNKSPRKGGERKIIVGGPLPVGFKISIERFTAAIEARVWERIPRVNWLPFTQAREFARSLRFKGEHEWRAWRKTPDKPADIPTNPNKVYAEWKSWGDWLGTRRFRNVDWRPFTQAREFARKLGFKSSGEWRAWCKTPGKRPLDIPSSPSEAYPEEWKGWGDWLGTGNFRNVDWRPFTQAREFARSLGFKSSVEWAAWSKTPGKRPLDIPSNPNDAYADEWMGWGDWLGTLSVLKPHRLKPHRDFLIAALAEQRGVTLQGLCDRLLAERGVKANTSMMSRFFGREGIKKTLIARINWRPFDEVQAVARAKGFRSKDEWRVWKDRPADIPSAPNQAYADVWPGWPKFLGTNNYSAKVNRRAYAEVRAIARAQGFKSVKEWRAWKDRPADIPSKPDRAYADVWPGWQKFLGTNNYGAKVKWCPFDEARAIARAQGFKSVKEWRVWKDRPADIPSAPNQAYADVWVSWNDFLGTGSGRKNVNWRPFDEVQAVARAKGFRSKDEWRAWKDRPADIPSTPDRAYADVWPGWPKFLGTNNYSAKVNWRAYEEVRAIARAQGFKSQDEWRAWKDRPSDIPSAPDCAYADVWVSWNDFLGTRSGRKNVNWCPFDVARAIARAQGFKSVKEWRAWKDRPADIPYHPDRAYADAGWNGWGDWLGTKIRRAGHWRPFDEARAIARAQGFKSVKEWRAWKDRPADIPCNPDCAYADVWVSWNDFLGTAKAKTPVTAFESL
jgi:superfamily II DNA or RNA helicase